MTITTEHKRSRKPSSLGDRKVYRRSLKTGREIHLFFFRRKVRRRETFPVFPPAVPFPRVGISSMSSEEPARRRRLVVAAAITARSFIANSLADIALRFLLVEALRQPLFHTNTLVATNVTSEANGPERNKNFDLVPSFNTRSTYLQYPRMQK